MPSIKPAELMALPDGESSAAIAARVQAARERQQQRQGTTKAELPVAELEHHCALDDTRRDLLHSAAARLGWSGSGLHRVQKLARTIADLEGSGRIRSSHVAEAMQWRRALRNAQG